MTDAIKNDGAGPYYVQDARSVLRLSVDWTAWLAQEATTITSSAWVSDAGITLTGATASTLIATVLVSGGVVGSAHTIRNTITCANGAVDSRSIRVVIRDR